MRINQLIDEHGIIVHNSIDSVIFADGYCAKYNFSSQDWVESTKDDYKQSCKRNHIPDETLDEYRKQIMNSIIDLANDIVSTAFDCSEDSEIGLWTNEQVERIKYNAYEIIKQSTKMPIIK